MVTICHNLQKEFIVGGWVGVIGFVENFDHRDQLVSISFWVLLSFEKIPKWRSTGLDFWTRAI